MRDISAGLAALVGDAHCLRDSERMEPYLVEERRMFRGYADAVVRPANTAEVAEVLAFCAEHSIAVVPQGGNTGVCGGGVPLGYGRTIVLSTEQMNRIRHLDVRNFTVTVEAGCILAHLQDATRAACCYFPLSLGGQGQLPHQRQPFH